MKMPAYKDDKRKTWFVEFYYRDMDGKPHKKTKRGFPTKREAIAWEEDYKYHKSKSPGKTFAAFWKNYEQDIRPKLRLSTWDTKEHIVRTKIMPFFGEMPLNEIKPRDIIRWQNSLTNTKMEDGTEYSSAYFKTVQSQLSAIFNHAVRYYDLESNPLNSVLPISGGRPPEFKYWTKEEFDRFNQNVEQGSFYYFVFQLLYWCGIREGELLALTAEDFDFEKRIVHISKTFTVIKGQEIINRPKTPNGMRNVTIPESLCSELREFITSEKTESGNRVFNISKTKLCSEFRRLTELSEVKRIRIHDLRHSHVSLLIHMGFSAVAIGERVGHKSERITYYYAHLFPGVQEELGCQLDKMRKSNAEGRMEIDAERQK